MSYKQMERRLAELEQMAQDRQRAWLASLSDAEFDALLEERWPGFALVIDALSDADRERLWDGTMSAAEFEQHRQRAQERIGL